MTDEQIAKLIRRRERLTNRRDERINRPAVAEIDAQLAAVPAGERNDVDLLLGRLCATPTPRADYLLDKYAAIAEVLERDMAQATERDYIQSQSAAVEQAAPLAEAMIEAWHEHLAGLSADEIKRLEAMTAERSGIMEHDDRDAGKWK